MLTDCADRHQLIFDVQAPNLALAALLDESELEPVKSPVFKDLVAKGPWPMFFF